MTPPQRNWVVPVAIVGFIAVLTIVALILLETSLAGLANKTDTSEPDYTPIPHPTPTVFSSTCASGCLPAASAPLLIPNVSLQRSMDIDSDLAPPVPPPTTAALEQQSDLAHWRRAPSADPDCFFLASRSPVGLTPGSQDAQSLDAVAILQTSRILGGSTMTQTARFFTDPLAASDYERQLQLQLDACHVAEPRVGAASGFDLPPSVTAVALADSEDRTTTYLYDFQRANVVVRFRIETSDGVNENGVRSYLAAWASNDLAQVSLN